ncbi:MAG: hypothetical protein JSS72_07215 [Armatimonadetes bacterium]|nr:hypothetical protein [Armatimonadota bacterium]
MSAVAMPPNSFLRKPVKSTSQLVAQVNSDSEVRDRYLRHFGMTRRELSNYFAELHATVMKQDAYSLVYNVPVSGLIRVRRLKLHKGEVVLVDTKGNRVIRGLCGNPLTLGPKRVVSVPVEAHILGNLHDMNIPDADNFVAENAPEATSNDEPAMAQMMPDNPPTDTPTDTPLHEAPQTITSNPRPGFPIGLFGLPIIGLLHHGGSSGGGSGPPDNPGNPPPPVPEPAPFLILAGAAAYLIATKRRS